MANAGRDTDRMSTLMWNARAFPELITYSPERELKTSSLRYNICIKSVSLMQRVSAVLARPQTRNEKIVQFPRIKLRIPFAMETQGYVE